MFSFIFKLFHKSKPQSKIEPIGGLIELSVVIDFNITSVCDDFNNRRNPIVIDKDYDIKIASFFHSRKRLRERYGYHLSREMYDEWTNIIGTKKSDFVQTLPNGAKMYMIQLYTKNVFVVVVDNIIRTVLPFNPNWVKMARSHDRKSGKASKNVGRGKL